MVSDKKPMPLIFIKEGNTMKKHSNGLSVAAMIYAFVFSPVGLIMGIMAKKKHPDDRLADAAFILSLVFIILFILLIVGCNLGELWLKSQP